MKEYIDQFKNCLQKEEAFCTAACPFHLNVRTFIEKIGRGNYNSAYKIYRDAVAFPAIVAALCYEPCKNVCPRKEKDSSIELNLLENACLSYATKTDPNDYNLPVKNRKIAIVGGGISGLACALRMCSKKYNVSVYEKSGRIGGHLWNLLPEEVFIKDINHQFKFENYNLYLNREITSLEELKDYDVIYVATGKGGSHYGLLDGNLPRMLNNNTAVFLGGSMRNKNTIEAIADGLNNAAAIERYLRTNVVVPYEDNRSTKMQLDPAKMIGSEPIKLEENGCFSKEEVKGEASRCLRCQCDACRSYSDLIAFYNKWPLRVRDEVMATILPGDADLKAAPAKRLINSCMMDGIFKETCPMNIDMDGMIMESRRSLHRQGKQPWAFHDFWMRDMASANGEAAALAKLPKGFSKSNYAFFPGCQLGASNPQYVIKSYEYLLKCDASTALILQCCGVPAEWAGDEEKHKEVIESIRNRWQHMGSPKIILACPTCKQKFDAYLPEIPTVFIYDIIKDFGITAEKEGEGEVFGIFDPCSSRYEPELRSQIRWLLKETGYESEPVYEDYPRCCSFGGQISIANPKFAEAVIKKRVEKSNKPYITYCINCRDIFASEGKSVLHILDILFNIQDRHSKPATVTERYENRLSLKKALLKKYWGDEVSLEQKSKANNIHLKMSQQMREKLDAERILESDIKEVITHCNKTKKRVHNLESGNYSGYKQMGNMTYWVEYRIIEGGIELINAYCHRMKIDLEVVWNGKRTETDM